jgi:hypothetical protein
MTGHKLTENEFRVMKVCLNYGNRQSQLEDNMSNGGVEEAMQELGWNAQQVGGLFASLEKKGYAYPDEDGVNGEPVDILWLTVAGVNEVFDEIESRENQG